MATIRIVGILIASGLIVSGCSRPDTGASDAVTKALAITNVVSATATQIVLTNGETIAVASEYPSSLWASTDSKPVYASGYANGLTVGIIPAPTVKDASGQMAQKLKSEGWQQEMSSHYGHVTEQGFRKGDTSVLIRAEKGPSGTYITVQMETGPQPPARK